MDGRVRRGPQVQTRRARGGRSTEGGAKETGRQAPSVRNRSARSSRIRIDSFWCTKNAFKQRPHPVASAQILPDSHDASEWVPSAHPSGQTTLSTAGRIPTKASKMIATTRRTSASISRLPRIRVRPPERAAPAVRFRWIGVGPCGARGETVHSQQPNNVVVEKDFECAGGDECTLEMMPLVGGHESVPPWRGLLSPWGRRSYVFRRRLPSAQRPRTSSRTCGSPLHVK